MSHTSRVLGSLIMLSLVLAALYGQTSQINQPTTVEIRGTRPLATALDRVQEVFRVPINYEETTYENPADLVRTTPATHPRLKPMIIPREGPLSFSLPTSSGNPEADAYLAVQAVLAAYTDAKLPGSYQAFQQSGAIDVAPIRILGGNGLMRDITPVMGRSVALPYAERSVFETLRLIMDSASNAAGVRIHLLNVPFDEHTRVSFGTTGQSVQNTLAGLLAKVGDASLSYRLLYEPNERAYYFSLAPITVVQPAPTVLIRQMPNRPAADNPFFIKK